MLLESDYFFHVHSNVHEGVYPVKVYFLAIDPVIADVGRISETSSPAVEAVLWTPITCGNRINP